MHLLFKFTLFCTKYIPLLKTLIEETKIFSNSKFK